MTWAHDFVTACWIAVIAITAFLVVPVLALGRPSSSRSRARWIEGAAGFCWTALTVILLVPALARYHLLNWATSVLTIAAWPASLWWFRYRGAPAAHFRDSCRAATLAVLTWRPPQRWTARRSTGAAVAGTLAAAAIAVFWRSLRELRFQSPADYDTLARARALLAGGRFVLDPPASLAAVLATLTAADPVQVIRFLQPLLTLAAGCAAAALIADAHGAHRRGALASTGLGITLAAPGGVTWPSLAAAFAWLSALVGAALLIAASRRLIRRDGWHAIAACGLALAALTTLDPAARVAGHLEYDAAARQLLRIARTFSHDRSVIVSGLAAPDAADPVATVGLENFVRANRNRAERRDAWLALPQRDVFVFVEMRPFPEAERPNARAHLNREALRLCEEFRRTHAGAGVFYEDDDLRVYHFRR